LYLPRDQNTLEKKKPMIFARKEHSCVYLNGKVYVISGYDGKNKGMAGCEAYDVVSEEWKPIKGLNTPRCAFAAIVSNSKIYVFGGYDGKERLSTI
jgi:N-acetylneuraminic acid mutarotase